MPRKKEDEVILIVTGKEKMGMSHVARTQAEYLAKELGIKLQIYKGKENDEGKW
jgi:hypothetical protein